MPSNPAPSPPSVRPPAPPCRDRRVLGVLLLPALFALPLPGTAQHVENLLLPRGGILLEAKGSFTQNLERIGAEGRVGLAGDRFNTTLDQGTAFVAPEIDRLRSLLGDPEAALSGGRFHSRMEVNDQRVPLRLGYGVMDRVTVGVTVPLVRRRVDAHLHASPTGANLGLNPALDGRQSEVTAFLNGARAALATLQGAVEETCQSEGETGASCVEGRAAEARVLAFVDGLDAAWDELDLFPVAGTGAGSTLAARWEGMRGDLSTWGASNPPESLPLAQAPTASTLARHRESWLHATWPAGGFPYTSPDMEYTLGDVQAHVVVGLVGLPGTEGTDGGTSPEGMRVRSAVELSLRFATGEVDSFAVAVPTEAMAGHAGVGVRWVSDLLLGDRAGLLLDLGWEAFQEAEGTMLGVQTGSAWHPFQARVRAEGTPGDRLRVALTPRVILGGGVSLGAGYEAIRVGEARWNVHPLEGEDPWPLIFTTGPSPTAPRTLDPWTAHRASVELRFAGWDAPLLERLAFPVELRVRASHTLGGTEGAPVQTRLELGGRVVRR